MDKLKYEVRRGPLRVSPYTFHQVVVATPYDRARSANSPIVYREVPVGGYSKMVVLERKYLVTRLPEARAALAASRRTAAFSRAGLSAESGIATFRGNDGHALWSQFNPMELASVAGFEDNPARVIEWYNWRRTQLARAQPNAAHRVLAKHPQLLQITQNVDDLLERAGVAASGVLHLHGTIGTDRCMASCGYEEAIDLMHPPPLRPCPRCGAYLRPAVVWFGEALPQRVWNEAKRICSELDCLRDFARSFRDAPSASNVRTKRSIDTVESPDSIFATRD